jgi:hypothetical protein
MDEMEKFRDFRGQQIVDEFKPVVPTPDLNKLAERNDEHVRTYDIKVGDGVIRIMYVYEPFMKLVGKYYALGTSLTFEEYIQITRGF